jgi:hypothetical protein
MEPLFTAGTGSLGATKSEVARGDREPTLPALVLIIVLAVEATKVGVPTLLPKLAACEAAASMF